MTLGQIPIRFPPSLRSVALLWVLAVSLVWAAPARAVSVLIVLSSEADPYQKAQAAVKDKLEHAQHSVTTVQLKAVIDGGAGNSEIKKAAVVVAVGTEAAAWLHEHLPATTPLTYCLVSDPQSAGLTEGAPVNGVSATVPLRAQLDLIKQALPAARSIGVLYRSNEARDQRLVRDLQQALPEGWQLKTTAVNEKESVAAAIDDLLDQKVDAVWTFADAALYTTSTVKSLLLSGLRRKVPVFGFSPQFVRAGALLGVGINPATQGDQAADLVLRQLGAAASSSAAPAPPSAPTAPVYQIAVNLIVMEALGVEVPPAVIERAAVVFRKEGTK